GPVGIGEHDVGWSLPLVKIVDALPREPQTRGDLLRNEAVDFAGRRDRDAQAFDRRFWVVETPRVFDERFVAARANGADDRCDGLANVAGRIPSAREQRCECGGVAGRDDAEFHSRYFAAAAGACRRESRPATASYFVRKRIGLTTKRAVEGAMSSTTTMSCSRRVLPVATKSTIRSASPTTGLSSTDPWSDMISAGRSRSEK